MKKVLAILVALMMVITLASCGTTEVKKNDYVLSTESKENSVIDGVMTDIQSNDEILTKTTASWLDKCVLYEVNVRQYTEEGTFKAFESHLQRLKDTGINTLWFMPIHPISEKNRKGTLGSYYAVSDYMAVNPEFGTMEDFQHLVDTAHEMGFKVILDWVANHTGWDHKWVTENKEYYTLNDKGEVQSPPGWDDTAELNYDNFEMRSEMIKCMQYWVEEVGIDGFRCDHAIGVPAAFWNAAVYKLKSINSELLMLAEVSATQSLTNYAFDSCYNDKLFGLCAGIKGGVAPSTLEDGMTLDTNYVENSFPMNYLDNHDKNSYNGSIVMRCSTSYPAVLAIDYLAPGMPLVYSGNEMFSDQELEFFEKDPIQWGDCIYQDLMKKLSDIKQQSPALDSTNADIEYLPCENSKVFMFKREKDNSTVYFVGNMFYEGISDAKVKFEEEGLKQVLHFDGTNYDYETKDSTGVTTDKMNAYEYYIFTK